MKKSITEKGSTTVHIRMLQIQHHLQSRRSRHRKYELIKDSEFPKEYESYIYDKSRFYRETFRMLQTRLLLLTIVLLAVQVFELILLLTRLTV